MSRPGIAGESSQDDEMTNPADLFHKPSYVKHLKQVSDDVKTKSSNRHSLTWHSDDVQANEVNEMGLTDEEKTIFNGGTQPLWEHSKIYSWVNASAEKNSIISAQSKPITKQYLWDREMRRYNALMQYRESDFDWVEKDTNRTLRPRQYLFI